jgi:O-antigen/teichoic acid export membrane protein
VLAGSRLYSRLKPRLAYATGEASNVLNLVLVALVARLLGVEPYGDLIAMLAAAGILGQVVEFGFPMLVARSVAQRPERGWAEIRFALTRQAALALPVLGLMFGYLTLLDVASHLHGVGLLLAASVCFQAMKGSLRGACRGLQRFGTEALFLWTERSGLLVFGVLAVALGGGLPALAAVFFAVRGVDLLVFIAVMYTRFDHDDPARRATSLSLGAAAPFAVGSVLWLAYYQVDTAMIGVLSTAHETGIYGAVYRFVDILHVLPRLIVFVTFPAMVIAWSGDRQGFAELLASLRRRLAYVALPAVLAIVVWSDPLLRLGFGDAYAAGAPALRMLAIGTVFAFYSVLYSQALLAAGRERLLARVLFCTVSANVLLNMLLMPRHGFMGAATATLITEMTYVGMLAVAVHRLERVGRTLP